MDPSGTTRTLPALKRSGDALPAEHLSCACMGALMRAARSTVAPVVGVPLDRGTSFESSSQGRKSASDATAVIKSCTVFSASRGSLDDPRVASQ
jgi:hypothetical protein